MLSVWDRRTAISLKITVTVHRNVSQAGTTTEEVITPQRSILHRPVSFWYIRAIGKGDTRKTCTFRKSIIVNIHQGARNGERSNRRTNECIAANRFKPFWKGDGCQ